MSNLGDGGAPIDDTGAAAEPVAHQDKIPWDWPNEGSVTGGTGGTTSPLGGQGGTAVVSLVSNTPGAVFENASVGQGQSIRLLSSNLLIDAPPRALFSRWFAEVRNESGAPLCLIKFVVRFEDGNKVQLLALDGFLDGAGYKTSASSSLTTKCIGAAMPSAGWTIKQGGTYFEASRVKRVVYSFTPFDYAGLTVIPHPNHPIVEAKAKGKAIEGQLKAKGTIYNIGLTFYPVMANGLIEEYLSDTHLDTLFAGSTWLFETLEAPSPFVRYLSLTSWIEGAKSAFSVPTTPEGSRWLDAMTWHQARQNLWAKRKQGAAQTFAPNRLNLTQ
ncbi:MAG: hypothetical protein SF187_26455 [Deltaproteobacteria bacterium]|nr:hypothetical protein [Deltaproteobacteria bacterium]